MPTLTAFLTPETGTAVRARARSGRPGVPQQRLRPHPRRGRLHRGSARDGRRRRLGVHRGAAPAARWWSTPSSTRSTTSTSSTTRCSPASGRSPPAASRWSTSSCCPPTAARSGMWARPSEIAGEPSRRACATCSPPRQRAGCTPPRATTGSPRPSPACATTWSRSSSRRAERARRWRATAPPARATPCSTTAASGPTCSPYTVDRNPYKHGRFTPGTRIPILPPERIAEDRPDYVLVLPWNLRDELIAAAVLRARLGRRSSSSRSRTSRSSRQLKVVLFCGGYGMRMRDGDSDVPKPMAIVGPRPLIWHVMRYYAHFGHTEFILCLGYGAHHIKEYFLDYDETDLQRLRARAAARSSCWRSDIADWTITFVHTGLDVADRRAAAPGAAPTSTDEEMFLANYADVLTDAPLDDMIDRFARSRRRRRAARGAAAVGVPLRRRRATTTGSLDQHPVSRLPLWENGGYFVLRPEIFDYIPENGDLVADGCDGAGQRGPHAGLPVPRLLAAGRHRQGARPRSRPPTTSGTRPWMLWDPNAQSSGPLCRPRSRPCVMLVMNADAQPPAGASRPARAARRALRRHRDRRGRHAAGRCAGRIPGCRVARARADRRRTPREAEERAALAAFCPGAELRARPCSTCPTGGCPTHWERAKERARGTARARASRTWSSARTAHDAHQDHRALAELVPTVFRDHLALGYEILKWESDLAQPTVFLPLAEPAPRREGAPCCTSTTASQRDRDLVRRRGVPRPRAGPRRRSATRATPRRSTPSRWCSGCPAAGRRPTD